MTTDDLNTQFAYGDEIRVAAGPGGMAMVMVNNRHAQAHIHLDGAHLTHFQPKGQKPVLWVSPTSFFQPGKPIRGGIPICWPWFGPHPTGKGQMAHGFARVRAWRLVSTARHSDGQSRIELALDSDAASLALWPFSFALRLVVTVGATLEVALTTTNPGPEPMLYDDALHTYLAVGDVRRAAISGLEGAVYLDKIAGARAVQLGPITCTGLTDRVYGSTATCTIRDPEWDRSLVIEKSGSTETVVWNPWSDKAGTFADFPADGWPGMVCVEAANCLEHRLMLPAGTAHTTVTRIRVA